MRRKLVVGNWKMNGSHAANAELLAGLQAQGPWVAEVAVCTPFPYLAEVALSLTLLGAMPSAHEIEGSKVALFAAVWDHQATPLTDASDACAGSCLRRRA